MKKCPICNMELSDPVPSFCKQCAWDLKNDPTFVASLDVIPDEVLEEHRQRVQIDRRNWQRCKMSCDHHKEIDKQLQAAHKKLSGIESQDKKQNAQEKEKQNQKKAWLKKAEDINEELHGDEKIKCYTNAIDLDSNDDAVYIQRGSLYLAKGNAEEAIMDFSKAKELNSKNGEIYYALAATYALKKEFERAIEALAKHIEMSPENSWKSFFKRGEIYIDQSEFDKAISDFTNAIELQPNTHNDLFLFFYDKKRGGFYKRVKLKSKYFLYQKRGIAHHGKRDYDAAISDFTKAIELNPKDDESFYLRGKSYISKGDNYLSIADFTRAIDLKPEQSYLLLTIRGATYSNLNDLDRAVADFTKAIKVNNKCVLAYFFRGKSYFKNGEYDRAIKDFTKAIKIEPRDGLQYLHRGLAYEKIGQKLLMHKDFDRGEILLEISKEEQGGINHER